jgi:hypothetical protein
MITQDGKGLTTLMVNRSQIHDYEIEEMIRYESIHKCTCTKRNLNWRHRAQYAVGHALNDFYTLAPHVRKEIPMQYLIERRWPRKMDDFNHPLHYWSVYNKIVEELTRVVSSDRIDKVPVMLYEQWYTVVPELDLNLSMIFQIVWQDIDSSGGMLIQKFLVDDDRSVIQAFAHMANVLCHYAFGGPAEEIEVYTLLTGRKHLFPKGSLALQESLDYVSLLVGVNTRSAELNIDCECKRCSDSCSSDMGHPCLKFS